MIFTDQEVTLDNGKSTRLKSLWIRRPVAFVFLRHFNCVFCRDHVAQLSQHPDLNIILVAAAPAEQAAVFRASMKCPFQIIADPAQQLFTEAQMGRASLREVVSFDVLKRGVLAMKAGHRNTRPESDPAIMGGVIVIGTNGHSIFEQRAKNVADNLSAEAIRTALSRQHGQA